MTLLPLLATLLADPLELNAGVATELRAGESPILGYVESHSFVADVTTPQLEADLKDRRGALHLAYSPRLVWQEPNALGRTVRPLLLQQATLSLTVEPSARTHLSLHTFGSYGQPDYSILPQLIGAGQGMMAQGSGQAYVPQVQTILSLSTGAAAEVDVTRRFRLELGVDANLFRPVGEQPAQPPGSAPSTFVLVGHSTVTASPGVFTRVTPNDLLGLIVNGTYATYSTSPEEIELALVNATISWRALRRAGDEVRLELGVTEVRELDAMSVVPSGQALSPTGRVEAFLHLLGEDEYGLSTRLRATVEDFVDPILAEVYPRALVSGQLLLTLAPDWSAGLQGEFATSLRTTAPAMNFDETSFTVTAPVRHQVNRHLIVEVGGRWSERAPAFVAPNFGFHERQLWGYLSLTASTRSSPPWSGR